MSVGERIAVLRKRHGMTQEQLADQLGATRQAVSKWESGKTNPDIEYIIAMSRFFHVSTDYLLLGQSSDAKIHSTNQSVTVTPANRGPCKNFCSLLYPVLLIMGICILLLSPLFATLYRNEIFEACGSAYTNAYLYLREWPILGIVLFGTGITAVGLGGVIAKYLKRRQF